MSEKTETKARWQPKIYDREHLIAAHFGFIPMEPPKVSPQDESVTKDCRLDLSGAKHKGINNYFEPAECAAFLRTYVDENLSSLSHPLMVSYRKPKSSGGQYSMHVIGIPTGLAEAILIRSALSMLSENGYKNLVVDINCIGEKDSQNLHERELTNHLRKLHPELSAETKKLIKKDILNILRVDEPELIPIVESAPSSLATLTSSARLYFKEVLEYLEALGIDFRISHELIGVKPYTTHSVFAVREATETGDKLLAVGYRYSRLSKRFNFRKELPLSMISILPQAQVKTDRTVKELPKPKFYLIHLGREAKLKVLPLLELLRSNKIPVYHFLGKDKITAQLTMAESLNVPYLLILGQKEALENTVTIRNTSTRAQDTIPLAQIAQFLKHITLIALVLFHTYPFGF